MRKIFLTIVTMCLSCSVSYADGFFQDIFRSPEKTGVIFTLFSGLGTHEKNSDTTNLVIVLGGISIGLFNLLELTNDGYSDDEVYGKNKDLFGAYLATVFLSGFFDDETESVNLRQLSDVTMVTYNF